MAHQVICISRSTGAEGEAVGRAVAERLGFRYVDDEVIARAAELAELDPELIADAERRKSLVHRILVAMGEQTPEALALMPQPGSTRGLTTDEGLRGLIVEVLRTLADEGSVVIVAHAASFALAKRNVLRVLVTASDATRTQRLASANGIDENAAAKMAKRDDHDRADYLKRFYGIDHELPTHFDLVINTDALTPETAAEVVLLTAG